ncbi:MAG: glycosyl hydrolase, partial [Candidatus Aminicenantes bacterium]|nr:glycosyl hydrolase [Candidatus Aminicenantes bacterium]
MKKYVVPALLVFAALAAAGPLAAQTAPAAAKRDAKSGAKVEKPSALTPELLSGLAFRNIGPALMSGRVSDIVIHPLKRHTWYIAVGSGGVWKTENAGTTWAPVFDAQASYSIGCVTLDPSNPETVWVGTGENVSGRHVGFGDGVYKSLNGGRTWTNMGLGKSEHIGRILVDPRNSNVVYVAAEGPLWSAGGERGLYKTSDGGKTWILALAISKDTGVTSVEFDPANPDLLYAAAYQRRRSVAAFMGGGPESGIHKSEDAGKSWRKLTVGLPSGDVGKIGLAVSPIDPRVVYATVEAGPEEKGFYRSTDKGESWEKRSPYISGGTGPHYYQEIFADPSVFDRVYQMDPGMRVTDDGGRTWRRVDEKNKHGDNHALAFVKGDPDYILNGSDGGVYETHDGGRTWRFFENLPVTQFYKLALDNALPFYNVHGGAQDNGSQLGPSRTLNANGISNFDWTITYGADGYATAIDPTDPNTVYLEWQEGNLLRYDRKSHETVYISPRPEPGDPPLRFNWDSPVVISPFSPTRIYYAGQHLWRSDDRGDSWTRISPDLT